MTNPKIRFAKKEDINSIVRLCEQHAFFENAIYDSSDKAQKLDHFLFSNNPSVYCLIVEKDNHLIGYATYMKQFSTWDANYYIYMDCLFMTKKSRGFGIGEKLINKIKLEAIKNQCTHIQWQTQDFNKRAIKFYNRIGAESKSKERFFLKV